MGHHVSLAVELHFDVCRQGFLVLAAVLQLAIGRGCKDVGACTVAVAADGQLRGVVGARSDFSVDRRGPLHETGAY